MYRRCIATAIGAGLILACSFIAAHEDERRHVHIGGGIPYPPFAFTMQTWYPDIVYDESVADPHSVSLDVYTAEHVGPNAPVLVFVRGGGFRVGDKASSKELGLKVEYFVSKLDFVFVSINYRLLPEGRYPTNAQDVANALAWVAGNVSDFGGDPSQMMVMGHSAGATLVAQVALDERFLNNAGYDLDLLSGVIVNDANYGVVTDGPNSESRYRDLYGDDWRSALPVAHVGSGKGIAPFLIMYATGGAPAANPISDSPEQAHGLADRLISAGVSAEMVRLDHVEHFGANERIGYPGDHTTIAVENFLMSITGRSGPPEWTEVRR